jgi:hypothetical protein
MTSASKAKGNSWERECAKILSNVFGYHFERNKNGSGAFTGGKNANRREYLSETQLLSFMADVMPPTEMKKMCVECKFYKEFPFHHFLINKSIPDLDDWIGQQYDAIEKDSFWFIAFKINRVGSYIVIPSDECEFIKDDKFSHSLYYYEGREFIVTEFEDFITRYKDEIFKKCS